jgi:hypothetical protein
MWYIEHHANITLYPIPHDRGADGVRSWPPLRHWLYRAAVLYAARQCGGGLERPVAVRFDPGGTSLYVVDFGVMTVSPHGPALNNKPFPRFLQRFQVRNGLGAMPAFSPAEISASQLDDLLAYLSTLRQHK